MWITSSILFALAGPFGTFEALEPGLLVVYWSSLVALAFLFAYAIRALFHGLAPKMPPLQREVFVVTLFSLSYTLALFPFTVGLTGEPWTSQLTRVHVFGINVALSIGVVATRHVMGIDPLFPTAESEPQLLRRLDGVSAREILRLGVDDHYVVVFLTGGRTERLLMRFSDAVHEIEGLSGHTVHRSHWVASDAIKDTVKEKGREKLILIDGSEVPVSRTYREALVSAGLI